MTENTIANNIVMYSGARKRQAVPAPQVASVVLRTLVTNPVIRHE